MTRKTLPKKLLEKQETDRQNTIMKIEEAIVGLKSQGYDVKIKDVMAFTGLSRSLCAKPHVRKVLIEHGIVEMRDVKQVKKIKCDNDFQVKLEKKESYIKKIQLENEQLKYEVELLRGELYLMLYKENNN